MLTIEQTAVLVSLFHPTEDRTTDGNYRMPEIGGNSRMPECQRFTALA